MPVKTLPDVLIEEGLLEEVVVEGSRRPYLAPAGFREVSTQAPDGQLRILGPLDPVLWDRKLLRQAFGFDYVWEVYKPKAKRRWGYYVCPLLLGEQLVGRLEGRVSDGALQVMSLWPEEGAALDHDHAPRVTASPCSSPGGSRGLARCPERFAPPFMWSSALPSPSRWSSPAPTGVAGTSRWKDRTTNRGSGLSTPATT